MVTTGNEGGEDVGMVIKGQPRGRCDGGTLTVVSVVVNEQAYSENKLLYKSHVLLPLTKLNGLNFIPVFQE